MRWRTVWSCLAGLSFAALPLAAQQCVVRNDAAYTRQILRDTTLPEFDTALTNHLPYDSCVDAPDKFLGHIIGAPNVLDKVAAINAYMRHLASQSPRVKVFDMGRSEEGREMILVAVSSAATITNLAHYRAITARLADPRGLTPAAADTLIAQGKPMYWVDGSIHSPETGSPEMLMELAYRLAVGNSPFIRNIRRNAIALITPVVETDGRDRDVELYMHHKAHPQDPMPGLIWWGHYVDHDNNRDGLTLALNLSRNMMNTFLAWHPQVLHDLHESEPYLYVSTGTGPYNPWLDPLEIDDWQRMAYYDIEHMNEQGVIGVWTHGFFDGWAPNYMLYVAIGHNAVGRFYETQGNGGADTRIATAPPSATTRAWWRPSPPLPRVNWSARDNANLEESGVLFSMSNLATNHDEFLRDFYLKSLHSVRKATTEGPAAWIFPANDPRPGLQARLLQQIQYEGVEIDRATAAFHASGTIPGGSAQAAEREFPAGSYIIRMDQPYSREADMLLGQEYYSPKDPPPYDDTGWTMGALANVTTVRVEDPSVLRVPMTRVIGLVEAPGGLSGAGGVVAIDANADPNLASFRYRLASTPMQAAERAFVAAGRHFNAGTIIIRNADAGAIAAAAKATGVEAVALAAAPEVPMHNLAAPRLAVMHNWQSTAADGWYRISLDQLKIPYAYIADTYVRRTPDLRAQYDVIIMPPMGFSLSNILNGVQGPKPIPWMNTPDMPDLAPPGLDSTPDIRGGLGLAGLRHLQQFVASGGLLILAGNSMSVATETGMAGSVATRPPQGLDAHGDVIRARVTDLGSPIAYGYSPNLDVYYTTGLLLSTAGGGFGRGGFGGGRGRGGRPSGIGSLTIPDVIQTRPPDAVLLKESMQGRPVPPPSRGRGYNPFSGRSGPAGPPPRIVVKFVAQPRDLLLSGLLTGARAIANQPMVVDATHGEGHIVLFAGNPMWRNETSGEFSLLLNAAMNYRHLSAGAKPARRGRGGRGGE